MQGREKKSREDFEVPHKSRIKIAKREIKAARNTKPFARSLNESPENSDDEEYQEKLVHRGLQWWRKVDRRFFRNLPPQELQLLIERTTSEELLALRHPAPELGSYFEEEIVAENPFLASPSLLRVLFRREVKLDGWERYELVSFAFKEYATPREAAGHAADPSLHLSAFRYPLRDCPALDLRRLELDIIDVENDQQRIHRLLAHDVVAARRKEPVEQEIELWEAELERVNQESLENWRAMVGRLEAEGRAAGVEEEVEAVRRELRMTEVLVCFKRGHGDKTEQMLEDALELAMIKEISLNEELRTKRTTRLEKLQCLFETDCKICFCTESDDKNPVLYCDACNASFHQACYGVERIAAEEKFFCEVCLFLQAAREGKLRKPACQVCGKFNFPMRQLDGHFYHVTCLVLFDLVEIRDYRLEFKEGRSHGSILEAVVENEVRAGPCAFCLKETGMKLACAARCGEWFHPICAYLNGAHFQLTRAYRALHVAPSCAAHHPHRDALNQAYLRRFFCDYRGTANKNDLQFEQEYAQELRDRTVLQASKRREAARGVMRSGRIAKAFKCSQPRAPRLRKERSEAALSVSKRESSEVASNPLPPNSETEITDTRRLLLKRSERNE